MTTPEEIEGSPPMREEHAFVAGESPASLWERYAEAIPSLGESERRRLRDQVFPELRSEAPAVTCATCRYFDGRPRRVVREAEPEASELAPASVGFEITLLPPEEGKCRLHGPVVLGWPTVKATDWCGEHRGR